MNFRNLAAEHDCPTGDLCRNSWFSILLFGRESDKSATLISMLCLRSLFSQCFLGDIWQGLQAADSRSQLALIATATGVQECPPMAGGGSHLSGIAATDRGPAAARGAAAGSAWCRSMQILEQLLVIGSGCLKREESKKND